MLRPGNLRPAETPTEETAPSPGFARLPEGLRPSPFTARRTSFVGLFARFDGYVKPILRRRKRAFVAVGIRTGRIGSLVEVENPHVVVCLVGICFEIEIPACTVGVLTAIVAFGSFYSMVFVNRCYRRWRVRITGKRRKDFQTLL